MARIVSKGSSPVEKAKALPWAAVLQGVVVVGRRWKGLSPKDRERIKQLLAQSGGRVNSLSAKQRKELRKLAGKLDLKGMGKELIALRGRGRRGRRRGA
jgi:TRAP-type C4-dicarboxylate transport system substrate-binding protein